MYEARKKGFDVHGIELNPVQARFIRHTMGIPCEEKSLGICSFGRKKFDVVFHSDVVSHFHDPIAEFRKIYRKTRPGGLLIFETGNFGDVDERYYSAYTRFQLPDHLFFFGERNLVDLLRLSGFELVRIRRYSILTQLSIMKYILLLRRLLRPAKYLLVWTFSRIGGEMLRGHYPVGWAHRPRFGGFRRVFAFVCFYATYLIRYPLGSILPKNGRPQTVIVTARKGGLVADTNANVI